jgi:hypothetical protein
MSSLSSPTSSPLSSVSSPISDFSDSGMEPLASSSSSPSSSSTGSSLNSSTCFSSLPPFFDNSSSNGFPILSTNQSYSQPHGLISSPIQSCFPTSIFDHQFHSSFISSSSSSSSSASPPSTTSTCSPPPNFQMFQNHSNQFLDSTTKNSDPSFSLNHHHHPQSTAVSPIHQLPPIASGVVASHHSHPHPTFHPPNYSNIRNSLYYPYDSSPSSTSSPINRNFTAYDYGTGLGIMTGPSRSFTVDGFGNGGSANQIQNNSGTSNGSSSPKVSKSSGVKETVRKVGGGRKGKGGPIKEENKRREFL